LCIFLLIASALIYSYFTTPITLEQKDIYGEYVIDRTRFPSYQADWQFNHFRFEITNQDSIYFCVTEGNKILQTYKGTIAFPPAYKKPSLVINIDEPRHHLIEDYPTLYREVRNFYYVFNLPKFGNVFFTKGAWETIDN